MPIAWTNGGSPAINAANLNKLAVVDDVATAGTPTGDALRAAYGRVFTPAAYGTVDTTGATDSSAAILAALAAIKTEGGGVLQLPAGTIRMDSQWLFPDDGTGVSGTSGKPSQAVPFRVVGAGGPSWDGGNTGLALHGTILDLRYNGPLPAKIDARGNGFIEFADLTVTNLGTADSKPFWFSTNPTVWMHDVAFVGHSSVSGQTCVQDAVVLGGQDTKTIGPAATDIFQGYGTVIERCFFDRVRRGAWLRASCNGVVVRDNMWTGRSGATTSEEALGIDGGSAVGLDYPMSGVRIEGNIFEAGHYPYVVRARNSSQLVAMRNGFYDYTVTLLACYKFEGDGALTGYPWIQDAHYDDSIVTKNIIDDTTGITAGSVTPSIIVHGTSRGMILSGLPIMVQPHKAESSSSDLIYNLKKFDNSDLVVVQASGTMKLLGSAPGLYVGNNVSYGSDGSILRTGSGQRIDLYAGTGANDTVRVMRGSLRLKDYPTASRPSATGTGVGTVYFDTTLNKPVYSDGTNWRDAAGTIV